ncbi:hypothetical protein KUM39_18890 [Streptomyces sp. J2-1]|uniref:hypothetical protein n=1 Tax=Streptomyces corallincola TaxID=2851888 RepID=UPI001C37EDAE|nr:hypothetical protein [Streptomyces corallincola]MBV2356420.1 hypothetical protein [Streptomyces corallincola]
MALPQPHIVALLCDSDFKKRPDTHTWSHRDGRPFTDEEQATALRATRSDFEELNAQMTRYKAYAQAKNEAPDTLNQFLAPFMERLTKKTLGNAVELMTETEQAEFNRLLTFASEPLRPFTAYTF